MDHLDTKVLAYIHTRSVSINVVGYLVLTERTFYFIILKPPSGLSLSAIVHYYIYNDKQFIFIARANSP